MCGCSRTSFPVQIALYLLQQKKLFSAALCEDTDQCATKGKIFKVPDQRTDFANAETFCEKDGGRLAKIRLNVVTDDTKSPLSQFFLSHFGSDCAWIGMSDRESEGDWVWNDGAPSCFLFHFCTLSSH